MRLDPGDLGRLLREIKEFDNELKKATVRRLREVANPAVHQVRHRILTGTSHSNTGLRKGLAAGTKVSVKTGARTAGVSITTTGAKLPPEKQPMVRGYDKATLRHPVFGHRDRWVTQRGRPYFGSVLNPLQPDAQEAIVQAVLDAAATITAGEVNS